MSGIYDTQQLHNACLEILKQQARVAPVGGHRALVRVAVQGTPTKAVLLHKLAGDWSIEAIYTADQERLDTGVVILGVW